MRAQVLAVATGCVFLASALVPEAQRRSPATPIAWSDTTPLHPRLEARGLTASTFPAYLERLRKTHARRVSDGDIDHLVFYLLQGTGFTVAPPIEPALCAKALVETLEPSEREAFISGGAATRAELSPAVRTRLAALLTAVDAPARDPRLLYFQELVRTTFPDRKARPSALAREYLRVMRFVYQKEFVAQRSSRPAEAIADLYRSRGLSTDTAVEAGYLVSMGLGIVKSLEPERQVKRVLVVGPGMDLAPRTALRESGPPESYQPWAVIDALVAHGLARLDDLSLVAADINPRVVSHLRRAQQSPPTLQLVSDIRESETLSLSAEYRDYFARLGNAIAEPKATTPGPAGSVNGHLRSTVRVGRAAAHVLSAEALDIVTERLAGQTFDLVIATNILPYFDDGELMLAMANVAAMLAPGGILLHNEPRPVLGDITSALGLPFEQSRHAVIATVRGAPAPLFDSVWLHRKVKNAEPRSSLNK
jgi:hypothetical protein